jgi:hypothetical protein
MKLANDWKHILKKAWSIRFLVLAGVLSGVEVILPFFIHDIPRGTFAVMSFFAVGGAFVSRIVAQRDFR